jgi:hypothetical protein
VNLGVQFGGTFCVSERQQATSVRGQEFASEIVSGTIPRWD